MRNQEWKYKVYSQTQEFYCDTLGLGIIGDSVSSEIVEPEWLRLKIIGDYVVADSVSISYNFEYVSEPDSVIKLSSNSNKEFEHHYLEFASIFVLCFLIGMFAGWLVNIWRDENSVKREMENIR